MRRDLKWRDLICWGLLAGLGAGAAGADTPGPTDLVIRSLELPAHRALAEIREHADTGVAPFQSDGCSGGMSAAWRGMAVMFPGLVGPHTLPPWETCCVAHDRDYHTGGAEPDPEASFDARLAADRALHACVMETGVEQNESLQQIYDVTEGQVAVTFSLVAGGMFSAVRLGGAPCSGLPWRWGFGYPHCSVLPGRNE